MCVYIGAFVIVFFRSFLRSHYTFEYMTATAGGGRSTTTSQPNRYAFIWSTALLREINLLHTFHIFFHDVGFGKICAEYGPFLLTFFWNYLFLSYTSNQKQTSTQLILNQETRTKANNRMRTRWEIKSHAVSAREKYNTLAWWSVWALFFLRYNE